MPLFFRKRLPRLEFRIPASPNERYMRMLHYFLESLQAFGGPIGRSAHTIVSIGSDEPERDLHKEYPWTLDYSVEFQWLDRELFRRDSYDATGYHRLWIKSDADVVVLADADILVTGDFDDVILDAYQRKTLLGFIAHVSPFTDHTSEHWWSLLFKEAGLAPPDLEHEHTGWGLMFDDPGQRYCPAYYNYGFIVAPRQAVEKMGKTFVQELGIVESVTDSWFKSQIANVLCFERHRIPHDTLSINYNFPLHVDHDRIRALNPDPEGLNSLEDVRVFHYLGHGEINKAHFETDESLASIMEEPDLSAAGKTVQNRLRIVHERIRNSETNQSGVPSP